MQEWHFKVDGFMDILPRILAAVNNLDKGKAVCAYHQAKDKAPEPEAVMRCPECGQYQGEGDVLYFYTGTGECVGC